MTTRSHCSGACRRNLTFAAAALLALTATAQGWQRVVNLNDTAGSAIGGGAGNTLYAGLGSGHVFRSTDNGTTWTGATNGLVDSFGRILLPNAFTVGANGRVLRGGPNASWQNRIGSPLFYSDDQGATWIEVPLPFGSPTRNPAGISVSDLVPHQGALYFSDVLSEGVWKSTDNGLTWVSAGEQLPTMPFLGNTKTYNAIASAGNALLTVQASKGVFRSTDGGSTWAQAVNGIPGVVDSPLVGGRSWSATDVVGADDGTAFVISDNRLYRTRDGGASWTEVGVGILQSPNPFVPSVILPSARKVELLGDRVFVSTSDGNPRFFEGTALGESWTELPRIEGNAANGGILAQSFYAHDGALYFAGDKGIHRLDLAAAVRTNIAPVVTVTPPAPLYANVGGMVSAAATARGTAPFTYEWRLNGVALGGQTAAALNFSPTGTNQAGTLSVVVSNSAGRVTNNVGQLIVAAAGAGNPDFSFRPQNSGAVTAFAIAPDGGVFYGGPFSSQLEAYTGVRRTFPDGQIDPTFITGAVIGSGSGPGFNAGSPRALLPLGDGSVLVGAAGNGDGARYYRRLLPSGALDATWPWPNEVAGGPRKIVRLADGKFLIAGGSVGGLHRLNPDGTFDATFRGPASIGRFQADYVSDFAVLPSGHILIVGKFDEVDLVRRVGIARLLPSGALDRGWVPASTFVGAAINTLAVQPDGRILIGGNFTTLSNEPRRGLARLNADGSLDPALGDIMPNISPSPTVNALALQPDGKVWVGGNFFAFAGHNYVVRLNADGTLDPTLPSLGLEAAAGGTVNALQLTEDGRLWVAAPGMSVGGQSLGSLVRFFTDRTGPTLGYAGLDQTPDVGASIILRGTVTGPFTGVQWRFKGTAISGQTSLNLPLNNVTLAASGAYDLVVTSVGGSYTSAPVNVRVRGPVGIDQAPLPAVGTISNSVSFAVSAFGKLPLGYQWFKDGEVLANATNRTLALTNLQLTATGDYAVRVTGGDGTAAASEPAFLTVVPPPGSTNSTFRLALPVADGFKDIAFLPDGRALVVGGFAGRLALLNTDGSVDPAFQFNATGVTEFNALERQPDGKLLILVRLNTGGGPFVVRRLNENGSVDASFAEASPLGSFPADLKLAPDGGILIVSQNGIERLNPDGSPDPGFNQRARFNNAALSVDMDPTGRIYVTGYFTTVGGQPRAQLARLLADGTLDPTFAPTNTFSSSWAVTALADGALVGDISGFYRFTEKGARDDSYGWGTRLAAWDVTSTGLLVGVLGDNQGNGVIRAADGTAALPFGTMKVPVSSGYSFLRVAPDGAIWLAKGAFGSVDPATLLYRLNGTVTPLALLTSPQSQTVNAGAQVTFSAAASGTSKVSYQWQRDGQNLPGETNATLILNDAQPANNGDYAVRVGNRSGSQTSRPATLIVLAMPEILSLSDGGEFGLGNTLLLSVNARGVAPLTYQWRRNGTPLPAGEAASYTNRAVALGDAGTYDVVVGNSLGNTTSAPVTVTVVVRPGAVITSFPDLGLGQGVKELNLLPDGNFLADGVARNRFGEIDFALPLTTTDLRGKLAVDPVRERIYMVDGPKLAFDLNGIHLAAVSRPPINMRFVQLEASGSLLVSDNGITPTLQRVDTNGAVVASFTPALRPVMDAVTQPDGKVAVLSYTQRVFQNNFVYDTLVARLLADGSLDPEFIRSTNTFVLGKRAEHLVPDRQGRLLVMGAFESFNGQPRSRLARFLPDGSLDASFVPPLINGEVTEVAEQLNGKLVIVGAFTQVDGQPRSLVARLNSDGSHDASFNPGTGLTLTAGQNVAFDVKILPAGEIVVAGTFQAANGLSRKGLVLLAGDTADLYFTREPADVELPVGGSTELLAAGTGTSAVTYQWFKGGEALPGQTGPTLQLNGVTADAAGDYRVVIRNASGELSSRVAKVAVITPPVVAEPPVSVVVNAGDAATFRVTATGLRLGYQWRLGDDPLVNATNATLTLGAVKATDAGRYSVRVFNPAGEVIAGPAQLRVRPVKAVAALPTNGLVGVHHFDGTLAEAANRYSASRTGSSGFGTGYDGEAVRITTGSDSVQLGQGPPTMFGTAYTVSFWINPEVETSLNVYAFVVGNREHYLFLGGNDNTTLGNRILLATRGFRSVHSSDDRAYVPDLVGKWTHFMVTYNGQGYAAAGNYAVYVNGESLALASSSNLIGGSARSGSAFGRYGGGANGASGSFLLDEVRLYNQVLSANDARLLANPVSGDLPPVLVAQPTGGSAPAGGQFAFTVEATGEGLFYEWYRGETLLPDADGPTLNLSNLTAAEAGDYRVVISNVGGSTNSLTATLTVNTATDPFVTWATTAGLTGDNAQPGSDADGDGANNFAEFYYGTSPTAGAERPSFPVANVSVGGVDYPAVTIVRRQNAGTAQLTTQVASSVLFTDDLGSTVLATTALPDGFERVVIRSNAPEATRQNQFFRLTVRP